MSAIPNTFQPVRACIFDVDGLLIDSEDIYTQIYNNILHEYGKPDLPWSIKAKQQSRGREGILYLLEWAQLPITFDEWTAKVAAQRSLFRNSKPLPGVPELLANLSQHTIAPVHIALASSASRQSFAVKTSHLPAIADAFPLSSRVFGDDTVMLGKKKKPAPDVFLLALERANEGLKPGEEVVKPEECLVFEDSVAGVEAGRKAGMRVVWVPHKGLAGVWKGREELVLMGTTEEDSEAIRSDSSPMGDEEQGGKHEEECSPLRSRDGWAEMLTTLEDFPYTYYSIQL